MGELIDFAQVVNDIRAREEARWADEAAQRGWTVEKYLRWRDAQIERDALRETFGARQQALITSGVCLPRSDLANIAHRAGIERTSALAHVERATNAIRTHAPDAPAFVVLSGGTGIGKTFACAWAIAELQTGTALRASELVQRLDPWRSDPDAVARKVNIRERVIVLDDLGAGHNEDSRFLDALGRLIDERLSRHTFITTNLPRTKLRERYGDRICDRLNHRGIAVELVGKNLRNAGAL